ncbi:sensor histidine kinase [Marinibactrum halimedae]|uniref:histidine kinase n=1 Tax=Marinibactrum halimedae TaxID=1444977 RepID=A0AA37T3M9_9GAMM|nr:ATP-binding protein [Marinibactrum halimedae]MCD9458403.1 sensor histidine kinase [Marinibactrum halimedae]GLS26100.1 sensor histidine kinase [Marinibactrum halimedae]
MVDNASSDFSLILASSVHDMKNSLGMLLHSLEEAIADTPVQSERQARQFATLQYEASRINGELIQLLSIYRMQENRMPIVIDDCYLEDVIEEQVARNHMLFETRGVQVEVDCDSDLNWYFDGELVGSVINNILVNCARYSKEKILVNAAIVDEVLELRISDDGFGYPDVMLEAPAALSQSAGFESGSTNLGLFFAVKVATMHTRGEMGGEVKLSNNSVLGGGEFLLRIP